MASGTMEQIERTMETTGYTHKLEEAVAKWPTPTGRDHKDGTAQSCQNVPVNGLLGRKVHTLPTPKGTDWKGSGISQKAIDREAAHFNLWGVVTKLNQSGGGTGGDVAPELIGGSLSPDWVLVDGLAGGMDIAGANAPAGVSGLAPRPA